MRQPLRVVTVASHSYLGRVLSTLSIDDVLYIHERVCADFAESDDPVGIPGPREGGRLLESTVARQHVGYGSVVKHPTVLTNAATLTFGLCCNHPFHNGNKRTALVAMLAHLDRNGYTLQGVSQRELYNMIKDVAQHQLGIRAKQRRDGDYTRREADAEVEAISRWLSGNSRKVKRGERRVTYRQLRSLLAPHGFTMDRPRNNTIGIFRRVRVRRPPLVGKRQEQMKHIYSIKYPGEGKTVALRDLKAVRKFCKLDEENGCDSDAFYEAADRIEPFINEYRTVLRKLSKE